MRFESTTRIHALIFNAQQLEVIPQRYKFDYSMNIPFSEDLEEELLNMKKDGRAQGGPDNELCTLKNNNEGLLKLSRLDTEELVNLSRLLYLKQTFPELDNKEQLQEKARRLFFIDEDRFTNIMDTFKSKGMCLV